jgi:hypothetical protein
MESVKLREVMWSDFVEWVWHLFLVMHECYCTACGCNVSMLVLKLFVLCPSSFITLQYTYVVIILFAFILLFYSFSHYFVCSVICAVSPHVCYCSFLLFISVGTTVKRKPKRRWTVVDAFTKIYVSRTRMFILESRIRGSVQNSGQIRKIVSLTATQTAP